LLDKSESFPPGQRELIDIQQKVKSKQLTLDEADRLFSAWKLRNGLKGSDTVLNMTDGKSEIKEVRYLMTVIFSLSSDLP